MKTDFASCLGRFEERDSYFLYGQNEEYVGFCQSTIAQKLQEQTPASIVRYRQEELLDNPALLQNQPSLFSPTPQKKVVIVDSVTDKAMSFLDDADKSVVFIFSALTGSSTKKIKTEHEKAKDRQFVGCYLNTRTDKAFFVNSLLQKHSLKVENEALQYLIQRVDEASDSLETDIIKSSLYCNDQESASLDDLQKCCDDALEHDVQHLIDAIAARDRPQVVAEFQKAELGGVEAIYLLRMLNLHFLKLLSLKEAISQGRSVDEAMRFMRPPIFFKAQPIFKAQLPKWSATSLLSVIEMLRQRETDIKSGRAQADTAMGRFLLSLTVL